MSGLTIVMLACYLWGVFAGWLIFTKFIPWASKEEGKP